MKKNLGFKGLNRKPNPKQFAGCIVVASPHEAIETYVTSKLNRHGYTQVWSLVGDPTGCSGVSYLLCLSSLALVIPIFTAPRTASCGFLRACISFMCISIFVTYLYQVFIHSSSGVGFKRLQP